MPSACQPMQNSLPAVGGNSQTTHNAIESSVPSAIDHIRQPRRGCQGRIPTNILVGGDIKGNVPTNIRGGNVVEYELLIASVKRKQR